MQRVITTIAILSALAFAAIALGQSDPTGAWRGALGPGVIDLGIDVVITGEQDTLTATIDIPAQSLFEYALADVVLDGDAISFAMPGVPGDPVFAGTIDGDRIEGTFTQGGQPLPFVLERDASVETRRPQEPVPPYPYREEEVTYASGDVTLAGTLTLPHDGGPFPALLLITGSGPQDRNQEILGHKPFLVLADALTRAGYAVLRVDDRGVGGSSGDDAQASFDDFVGDVRAGVSHLAGHDEIDAARIGLLGHSQGGFLAPAVAARDPRVAFVILLAGPAVDGFATLVLQNERIFEVAIRSQTPPAGDDEIRAAIDSQVAFLEALRQLLVADDDDGVRALIRERVEAEFDALPPDAERPTGEQLDEFVTAQAEGATSRAFRDFLLFDPAPYLRELTVPTLALYGGLDLQVDAAQSEGPMRALLEEAGNPDATVLTLPGLNHLMQPATTGALEEYGTIETTIAPEVIETIVSWLDGRVGGR